MPEQLTFLSPPPPPGAVPAWETLQGDQQAALQSLLARLMQQMILAQRAAHQTEQADD